MPRTISASEQTAIEKPQTQPYFLIDVHLPNGVLRYSTLRQVTFDGNDYSTDRSVTVGSLKPNKNSSIKSSITYSNVDIAISTIFMRQSGDWPVTIRSTNSTDETVLLVDTTLLFVGESNGFKVSNDSVVLSISNINFTKFSPGIVCTKADFSFLPPPGTVIRSGTTTITLDAQ